MPNLNNTVLHSMPVSFPSKEVQTEIADCLDATEQKMAIHERKHATLAALFRTMLHQLMTAQIRVHDLDLEGLLAQAAQEFGDSVSPKLQQPVAEMEGRP